jgi:hypothetical protein
VADWRRNRRIERQKLKGVMGFLETVYLVSIYDKSDQKDISDDELNRLLKVILEEQKEVESLNLSASFNL